MNWYKNRHYLKAKKDFIDYFSPRQLEDLHFNLPRIVFICGGHEDTCPNRRILESYFKKHLPQYLTFRAENSWEVIQNNSKATSALELEEWLADFSDVIIIIVESFGTVAELGAFSMSSKLRKRLLPIIDIKYEKDNSFLNTGPIRWINKDSNYSPAIYTDFSTIVTCMDEIENKFKNRKGYWSKDFKPQPHGKYNYSNKVLLFYYVYLISSLGPIEIGEIIDISETTLGLTDSTNIKFVLSIGAALEIFRVTTINKVQIFTCVDYKKLFLDATTQNHLYKIQLIRAKNMFSLLKIDEYKKVLDGVK